MIEFAIVSACWKVFARRNEVKLVSLGQVTLMFLTVLISILALFNILSRALMRPCALFAIPSHRWGLRVTTSLISRECSCKKRVSLIAIRNTHYIAKKPLIRKRPAKSSRGARFLTESAPS